jgi:V/A-type H+-transporting ATPase subunit E
MDIQLQELIEKIKREGVEAAKTESAAMIAEAGESRKAILATAEREAALIVQRAKAEALRSEEAGRAAIAQAARDLVIAFRDRIGAVLEAAVKQDVSAAYGPELIADAVSAALKAIAAGGAEDLSVLLPADTLAKLGARFKERLAAELGKGVELRPFEGLAAGFRIVERAGAAYYDFSADAVAGLFASHLNASLAESVRSAVKGM